MVEIPLTQGKVALIDDEDAERVMQWKWTAMQIRHGNAWYARRAIFLSKKTRPKTKTILLHRFLVNAPEGVQVDHRNRNGLDNRKENLRLATNAQNHQNMVSIKRSETGYRGVGYDKKRCRFYAKIRAFNVSVSLGWFDDAISAARLYDLAARKFHREFATLNFPDRSTDDLPQIELDRAVFIRLGETFKGRAHQSLDGTTPLCGATSKYGFRAAIFPAKRWKTGNQLCLFCERKLNALRRAEVAVQTALGWQANA